MILVDSRVGSHDLVAPLLKSGLPVEETTLLFGDVAFAGKGPNGTTLDIGIELKRLSDLVGSLRSGRLAGHQLPGLREAFDYYWLIVEGYWHVNPKGQLLEKHRRGWHPLPGNMSAAEMEKHVLTLELCGGFHTRFTNTRTDTLQFIATLFHWWQDRALDKHTSHLAVHVPRSFLPVTKRQAALMAWPDIGRKTALAAEQHFGSIRRAANAGVTEWAGIETKEKGKTRRVGTRTAESIVAFVEGKV